MPHLLMFDVDGTLVDSLAAEATCYTRACEEALGLDGVSSDWQSYRTPSDSGIVSELVERHFGRRANAADLARVERRFFALLQETYGARPELCREVAGAVHDRHFQRCGNQSRDHAHHARPSMRARALLDFSDWDSFSDRVLANRCRA